MMEESRRSYSFLLLLLIIFTFCIISYQYALQNSIELPKLVTDIFNLFNQYPYVIRGIYVALMIFTVYLTPGKPKTNFKNLWLYFSLMVLFAAFVIAGFTGIHIYDMFLFPVVLFIYTILAVIVMSNLRPNRIKNDKTIFGCSCEESDFFFELPTDEGLLRIHNPELNIWVDGATGSGKSVSTVYPFIEQCAMRNYAGFIYDYEGDPTRINNPILSRIAYACLQKHNSKLRFGFINFTDMLCTQRINVLSPRYMPENNESTFIRNMVTGVLKNLEPSWKEKTDFWANNAINFVYSIAYKCFKDRDRGINTFAHVIAFSLSDMDKVFKWLSEDKEISFTMQSMLSAWKKDVSPQVAGIVSSAQTPMAFLNNKNIFWVLSPPEEEEFDLDITNKNNPTLLCVGNSPSLKETISPIISTIATVVMNNMNQSGKSKSVFMVDEFPTIIMHGIDQFMNTARKHNVATILTLQNFEQAVRDYGKSISKILKSACGNQFYGRTANPETAHELEKLFGEQKEIQQSMSKQHDNASTSTTDSLQKEKIVKARDILSLMVGHFIGVIANGIPPYFKLKIKKVDVPSMPIPKFSKRVNTGDPLMDKQIMNGIVDKNYQNILSQVNEVLEQY